MEDKFPSGWKWMADPSHPGWCASQPRPFNYSSCTRLYTDPATRIYLRSKLKTKLQWNQSPSQLRQKEKRKKQRELLWIETVKFPIACTCHNHIRSPHPPTLPPSFPKWCWGQYVQKQWERVRKRAPWGAPPEWSWTQQITSLALFNTTSSLNSLFLELGFSTGEWHLTLPSWKGT